MTSPSRDALFDSLTFDSYLFHDHLGDSVDGHCGGGVVPPSPAPDLANTLDLLHADAQPYGDLNHTVTPAQHGVPLDMVSPECQSEVSGRQSHNHGSPRVGLSCDDPEIKLEPQDFDSAHLLPPSALPAAPTCQTLSHGSHQRAVQQQPPLGLSTTAPSTPIPQTSTPTISSHHLPSHVRDPFSRERCKSPSTAPRVQPTNPSSASPVSMRGEVPSIRDFSSASSAALRDYHAAGLHEFAQTRNEPILESPVGSHEAGGKADSSRKLGRRKINIEYIRDKSRRHITFSKRKAGIMKKAHELSTLTGTEVLLLVASETGLLYTYTTRRLQPVVTQAEGKRLILDCLGSGRDSDDSSASPTSPSHGI